MPEVPLSGPIVVAGDITVDWLTWTHQEAIPALNPDDETPNWERHQITRRVARAGGAMLLARMLAHIVPARHLIARFHPTRWQPRDAGKFIESFVELAQDEDVKGRFKITQLRGFGGPEVKDSDADVIPKVAANPAVLVLDDAGNGFRKSPRTGRAKWATWLTAWHPEWIVLKLSRPLARTGDQGLWDLLRPKPPTANEKPLIPPERLVVIVNADDLREHGIKLTPRLSWETTAEDFVRNIGANGKLGTLTNCHHLLIRFGTEAVIHYGINISDDPFLYFDPRRTEGDIAAVVNGEGMVGQTAAFTAAIAADIAMRGDFDANQAIRRAMQASAALVVDGFRQTEEKIPDYDLKNAFKVNRSDIKSDRNIKPVRVAIPTAQLCDLDARPWRILENRGDISELARRVASQGVEAALGAPIAQYGDLTTADRKEVEALRAIRNLLDEYVHTPTMKKPLSIAVFGPPGSGKSFTVKQLADGLVNNGGKRPPLEFNLSQFDEVARLTAAFRLIQDRILATEIPMVFFDEFDSSLKSEPLGWLKYFLAPMHDGEFRDGEVTHPLGRAIFVFAGGTRTSFKDFSQPVNDAFKQAKGPDFLSRLRGHVDIMGIEAGDIEGDHSWPVRRAIPFRFMLKRRARGLSSTTGELAIDDGVLHAFLTVPKFLHGVRSMEAILDMCRLSHARRFTASCLPKREQLAEHVDPEDFLNRVRSEQLSTHLRVELGILIHNAYRAMRQAAAAGDAEERQQLATDDAMVPWSALSPDLRESNCQQADAIPRRLRRLNMYMIPHDRPPIGEEVDHLPPEKIDLLAELEHERYVAERLTRGWKSGPRDPANKKTPFLIPWCDVPEKYKNYDRHSIGVIPEILRDAGYRICEMPKIE